MKWQPIETAPRDKTIFLYGKYWSDDQGMMKSPLIGQWNERSGRFEVVWTAWFGIRPTHWMPLPDPPEFTET